MTTGRRLWWIVVGVLGAALVIGDGPPLWVVGGVMVWVALGRYDDGRPQR